jgi:hypothetical protein
MSELGKTDKWATTKLSRVVHARQGGIIPWSVCVGIAGQFGAEWLVSFRVANTAGKYGKTKSMYVGIRGGVNKIREMTPEQIKARKVLLLDTKQKSNEWIPIADFWHALEEKGFQFD